MLLMRIKAGLAYFTDGRSLDLPVGADVRQVSPDVWHVVRRTSANYQGAALHRGESYGQIATRLRQTFGENS